MKKFTLFLSALLLALGATEAFGANPATMKVGQNASTCTVNGTDGIKVGTSNKAGDMSITVPANATSLQFYAAAWNKVNDLSLSITPEEKVSTSSIALTSDAGLSNNSPFTLSGDESSYYFEIDLKDITEETTLTFAASKRFVVWGATYTTDGTTPEDPETPTEPEDPETPTEPEQPEQPEGVLTCAEAVAICQETGETATTESYTVRGYVTVLQEAYNSQFGNATFYIADTKDGGKVLLSYRVKPENDAAKAVKVGDYVEVIGTLVNYKGNTPEVSTGGKYTIVIAAEGGDTPVEPEIPEVETVGDGTEANPFTVEDVIALNNTLSGKHYVRAYIVGHANGASFADGLDLEAPFEGSTNTDGSVATQGTNLAIASTLTPDIANIIPVQLPKNNLRNDFNLVEHPEMLGKQVLICGELVKYFSLTGIKNPTSIVLVNTTETAVDNVTVNQNITKFFENGQLIIIKDGVKFNAQGQVVK